MSEWTLGTLKELMEARIGAVERATEAAFVASEKAITKAETAQTAYNARSNEFRAALDDQNKTFMPRIEADGRFKVLQDLLDAQGKLIVELQKSESRGEGGTSAQSTAKSNAQWGIYITVIIGLAVCSGIWTLALYLLKH